MSISKDVSERMDYIQKTFVETQRLFEKKQDTGNLISLLNTYDPEYRSVAYESASMEIGSIDLKEGLEMKNWKRFRQQSGKEHFFHVDIGLGWAFAKSGMQPDSYFESLTPVCRNMVFDGIAYYNGLFKIRSTIRNQEIPSSIQEEDLHGFDQGLGRRLWYLAKGEVDALVDLLRAFPQKRQPDLWRGIGIACGYVGGTAKEDLEFLLNSSSSFRKQLRRGIVLATISRLASDSVTRDIERALLIICNKTITEIKTLSTKMINKVFYLYRD